MKRVVMAILSALLLSCQGPAAVLAQQATAPAEWAPNGTPERPGGPGRHPIRKRVTKETRRPSMLSDEPRGAATCAVLCAAEVAARPNPASSGNSLSTAQSVNPPLART